MPLCIECNKNQVVDKRQEYCTTCLNETKICRKCQQRKSIFEFEKNQKSIARKISRRGACKECRKHKKSIPLKKRKEYEKKNPCPAVGEKFYCPVCQNTITRQHINDVVLDHSHKTGQIRGWVCRQCNSSMGMMEEDTIITGTGHKMDKRNINGFYIII